MNDFYFTTEYFPQAKAVITFDSSEVFREDEKILPATAADGSKYIPWGNDNLLPYRILSLFEEDETLAACQMFNSEVCYAGGLRLEAPKDMQVKNSVADDVDRFLLNNNIPAFFLGTCKDIKYFEFAISVLIFSKDGSIVTNIFRKEVVNCRFAPAQKDGYIPYVLYANWRISSSDKKSVEKIPVIDARAPLDSIECLLSKGKRKMAFITRVPAADSFYYPIPTYGSLFKGKWYNIKKFIGISKEANLKNSAPLNYLIEISNGYFEQIFRNEKIIDPVKQAERVKLAKEEILDFLTGAENAGKALFASFDASPEGKELHHVKITKIESQAQGGDWETDHQEAVNMMCFAMRVHSNLVGSVPGKSNSNNSGSDKRELYTIAQAIQRPYHDLMFSLFKIIIRYNGWEPLQPVVPYIQLTTLDEHKDFKQVSDDTQQNN